MQPKSDGTTQLWGIGIVLRYSPTVLGIEPFYENFIAGLEDALAPHEGTVLLQIVPTVEEELASYRRWAASGDVAGVVLGDLVAGDLRIDALRELGIPTLVLGELDPLPQGVAAVRVDNYTAMRNAVAEFAALGHRTMGRVSGPAQLLHTLSRTQAFETAVAESAVDGRSVEGDYSLAGGTAATRRLLDAAVRPTAIIYDNDVMAVGGLHVAAELGIAVPEELSLLAWDDSTLCRLSEPPLSAMSQEVHVLGEIAARSLLALIGGHEAEILRAPQPRFIARGTTGRAPITIPR